MFTGTIWAIVPPIVAIGLALITKEVYLSLFCGVVLGSFMVVDFHPWLAFTNLFETMTSSIDLNIIIFDVLLGMIIDYEKLCREAIAKGAELEPLFKIPVRKQIGRAKVVPEDEYVKAYAEMTEQMKEQIAEAMAGGEE